MVNSNSKPITPNNNDSKEAPVVIQTDAGASSGQTKCPKCGATDIIVNTTNGKLRCNFCRHEFEPEKLDSMEKDINNLSGMVVGSGATNIDASASSMITLKCSSCGAEVVIDTNETTNARCHWCRNALSINEQVSNGAVPDTVLPFSVTKKEAQESIENFVKKRKFFANPKFKKEFTTDNIMGVYFPYMLVDFNAHSKLVGQGEKLVRQYVVRVGDRTENRYDADLFDVDREYDITIEGLSVESNKDRLNNTSKERTNNIINSIMPFDTENCVKWDANYLRGYSSEKRDINVDELKPVVDEQGKDISRFAANETLKEYNRGVRWDTEVFDIKGEQWKSAYLPVWLYSYMEKKGEKQVLHYVAVNARTKETMGSVPIHMPLLIFLSVLIEIFGMFLTLIIDDDYRFIFLTLGFIFFFIIKGRYRNASARHTYETDTKKNMANVIEHEAYVKSLKGLSNSRMIGANNKSVKGTSVKPNALKEAINESIQGDLDAGKQLINMFKTNKK